jgi:hypothetical protein
MPEINEKQVVEKTRAESDATNLESRTQIHEADVLQVGKLHEQITELQKIAINNCNNIQKLLPLVPIIPTVEAIVKNQEANTIVGKKVLKVIGVISAVVGLLYLIFHFWGEIKGR